MILFHGTRYVFDKFKPGSFFSDVFAIAAEYANCKDGGGNPYLPNAYGCGRVLMVRVDLGDVLNIDVEELCLYFGIERHKFASVCCWSDVDMYIRGRLNVTQEHTAIVTGLNDMSHDGREEQTQYVVRDPSRITILDEVPTWELKSYVTE